MEGSCEIHYYYWSQPLSVVEAKYSETLHPWPQLLFIHAGHWGNSVFKVCADAAPLATNCSWNSLFLLQHIEVWVIRGKLGPYPNISRFGLKGKTLLWKHLVITPSASWNNRSTSTCNCKGMLSCLRAGLTWVRLKACGLVSNWFLSKQSKPRVRLQRSD